MAELSDWSPRSVGTSGTKTVKNAGHSQTDVSVWTSWCAQWASLNFLKNWPPNFMESPCASSTETWWQGTSLITLKQLKDNLSSLGIRSVWLCRRQWEWKELFHTEPCKQDWHCPKFAVSAASPLFPSALKRFLKWLGPWCCPVLLPTFLFLDLLFQCLLSFPYVCSLKRDCGVKL